MAEESLRHVLSRCKSMMGLITDRHNSVLRLLYDAIPVERFKKIDVDRLCQQHLVMSGERQRPDLVAEGIDGKTIILDVTCPFVNGPTSLEIAAERKLTKYEGLATNIHDLTGDDVQIYPFVVGSLGCWSRFNEPAMKALGIPRGVRSRLKKQMVLAAISGSQKVWNCFIDGCHKNEGGIVVERGRRRREERSSGSGLAVPTQTLGGTCRTLL